MKAIIFDMDGTLFQTATILEPALEATFDELRKNNVWDGSTPIELYRSIMGVPLPIVWQHLLPNHSASSRHKADTIFQKKLIELIANGNGALYPHVLDIFRYLEEKDRSIFIASNGLVDYLRAIVQFYKLDQWILETFSIQQIDSLDKGELVKLIKESYSITDAIVVGDRLSDFSAAKENGFPSIGCDFDFAHKEELSQADIIIQDLREIKKFV
ncbi:HAD family hydrolase [Paenisporosarcina cavernae]